MVVDWKKRGDKGAFVLNHFIPSKARTAQVHRGLEEAKVKVKVELKVELKMRRKTENMED